MTLERQMTTGKDRRRTGKSVDDRERSVTLERQTGVRPSKPRQEPYATTIKRKNTLRTVRDPSRDDGRMNRSLVDFADNLGENPDLRCSKCGKLYKRRVWLMKHVKEKNGESVARQEVPIEYRITSYNVLPAVGYSMPFPFCFRPSDAGARWSLEPPEANCSHLEPPAATCSHLELARAMYNPALPPPLPPPFIFPPPPLVPDTSRPPPPLAYPPYASPYVPPCTPPYPPHRTLPPPPAPGSRPRPRRPSPECRRSRSSPERRRRSRSRSPRDRDRDRDRRRRSASPRGRNRPAGPERAHGARRCEEEWRGHERDRHRASVERRRPSRAPREDRERSLRLPERRRRERSSESSGRRGGSRSRSGTRDTRSCSRFSDSTKRSESYGRNERSGSRLSEKESSRPKELSDREKILEEYKKNYCDTSEEILERIQKLSNEKHQEEEEANNTWYRSSPADLYYQTGEGAGVVRQTPRLAKLCDTFMKTLIERGRNARPEVDELPPPKTQRPRLCKHKLDHKSSSSASSSDSDEDLDEDGLQGEADRVMQELQRKQSHPRRLHPEMWYNSTGEMNGGPLCRCNARAKRQGMRHGVYADEHVFPRCHIYQNNLNKLYHYRITVSPATNFLIKTPTIINHDEHEFLFAGFSLFSHYKLAKLPKCKVIRFNIEYTILFVEEAPPHNFTIQELELFEEYLFTEILELVDLDLGKVSGDNCSQFHFMPRFVRSLPEGGCEVLSMCEVLRYLINESGLLVPPEKLKEMHHMDHYTWQRFVDRIKGMIVTYPGKKPCSVRVDQLDRNPPDSSLDKDHFYPEIVHFGIRPPQLSYAGNPEYQKAWRFYVKYKHLIANMSKPPLKEKQKLQQMENKALQMRMQTKMKRDVTVAISSQGFHSTGLMCDLVQHAMLLPVLVRHLRFHKSVDSLEEKIKYKFASRHLLQKALTHPSYRENFGTNPDHARNSLTNCGIRQPQYGDRKIHYMNTRKKGINTLIDIMSRFGKSNETESAIKHNERLEFLGDAVVEFLSSIHLFRMFPGLAEGGLATYRAAIVQNQHLAVLAKKISLEKFMLYAHGSDLCRDVVMRHAMANCFEALMGALFLDGGIEVADKVFSLALWYDYSDLLEVWNRERPHPLQEQEPLGDRKYIQKITFLQRLTAFEKSIGVTFKHIRLLARAFTDRSVGYTHLTLGSNQRLEFLGDTVLQLVVSDRLYRHFPEHHEGHLSLLRSSLVNNRTQSIVCDDLNMSEFALYNNPKAKPTTKKHKADLLEAFLGALYIDKGMEWCVTFCNVVLFPRLHEFISNQDWNDPKSKLQQCCLTLRSMEGGEPDIPIYKVIESQGPTNTRVYRVAVYFRGVRLAAAHGHSIQEAEMNAASGALISAHELFPQLQHQKRFITKHKNKRAIDSSPHYKSKHANIIKERVPKAYRIGEKYDELSSGDEMPLTSDDDDEPTSDNNKSDYDELISDIDDGDNDNAKGVTVSSWVSDMERLKENLIKENKYEKLKRKADSDNE